LSDLRTTVSCGPEEHDHGTADLAENRLRLGNRIRRSFSRPRSKRSLASFKILLSTAVRSSIPGLSSAIAEVSSGSPATVRVFPPATISRWPGRGFVCFAGLEHVYPEDACRPEDGHRQRPVRSQASSPLIHYLQVRDVHRAKCVLGNRTWVHRTFAVKYGPALEFVLRERTIGSLPILRRGASSQVNRPTPGIDILVEGQRIPFHSFAHKDLSVASFLRRVRARASSFSVGRFVGNRGQICRVTAL
jgi:hypothetical protein